MNIGPTNESTSTTDGRRGVDGSKVLSFSRRTALHGALGAATWAVLTSCSDGENSATNTSDSAETSSGATSSSQATAPSTSEAAPDGTSPGVSTPPNATGSVPAPVDMIRTSWSTDEFTLGSYSYLATGASPDDRAALRTPVAERLFFAGEATSADAPSTVHGALESGRVAAEAVAEAGEAGESVLVIGAGAAGLQCATDLKAAGFNVVVVEARDRIGGRLDTVQPKGWPIPVERGASWVHDTSASDLAQRLGAIDVATVAFDYSTIALGADGRVDTGFEDRMVAVGDTVESITDDLSTGDESFTGSLEEALQKFGENDLVESTDFREWVQTELVTEYGAGPDELSGVWGLYEGSEGDDVLVTGGYANIAKSMADDLDVRVSTGVTSVKIVDDGVTTTTVTGEIPADRVVVTVPIGVLQAGTIAFDPPLPDGHTNAIEAIQMGLLDKFWFRFDEPFWSNDDEMWVRLTDEPEPFTEWFNVHAATGEPVLLALMGGDMAREWASRPDGDVIAAATAALESFIKAGW